MRTFAHRRRGTALAYGLAAWALCQSSTVLASGIEETANGAVGLGRAASHVRVNDFMATWQNPANLALIPGTDLGGELRLPLFQSCFDRAKDNSLTYQQPDASLGLNGSESFQKVCNDATPMPTGHLGFARSFAEGWGFGIGLFTPAAVSGYKYGEDTTITQFPLDGERFPITASGVESPNRFLLLERKAVGGYLAAGLGAQPIPELRIGISAALGVFNIQNRSVASVQGGTFEDQEILNDVNVTDWVVPRFMMSAVFAPVPEFEIMASVTYHDDVKASGNMDLTANGIQGVPLADCREVDPATGKPAPGPHCRITDVQLTAPMPTLEAMLGLRYAQRRTPRTRVSDPIKDEIWDIEVNAYWSQTSHVDQFEIDIYKEDPGTPGAPAIAFSTAPGAFALATPPSAVIARGWKDTFGIRAGGDLNVVPSLLSLRTGISYETRAVPVQTMNIDSFPVAKLGLHFGATFSVDNLLFHVGYAHLFYQSVEVPVGRGEVLEIASQNQDEALAVNEGHYSAGLDVVSVGGSVRF